VEEAVTRGGAEHPSEPPPVPLAYATASPRGRRTPGERQFWVTWGALLVLGIALFVGGLATLLAAGRDQGGYLLLLAVASCVIVVTLRRQSRWR
jgi:uncharacterized membrane protein YhaH (DUF805 family)